MRTVYAQESLLWQAFCCLAVSFIRQFSLNSFPVEHLATPTLIGPHETINFGDLVYLDPFSLEQIHLIKGFGPKLTQDILEKSPKNVQDILATKGIGPKRSAQLERLQFLR